MLSMVIASAEEPNSSVPLNSSQSETIMLKVVSKGVSNSTSNDRIITIAFLIENGNNKSAIENTQYQLTLYDPTGKVLSTKSGEIHLVFPGERVGISDTTTIPENAVLDKLDIQLSQGSTIAPPIEKNPLTSSITNFYPHPYAPKVTGIINNSLDKIVESAQVMAIAYDKDGNIIGGGNNALEFVPAEGHTGIEILMNVKKEPQKVEIYPILLDYSKFTEPWPDRDTIKVEKVGSVLKPTEFYAMFTVKNPSTNLTFGTISYRITLYDASGRILGAESKSSGEPFYPGERKGIIESFNIPDNTLPSRIEIQALPLWASNQTSFSNPLRVGKVDFISDNFAPKATGIINSSWPNELQYISLTAIAYDQNDRIIGGGNGFVSFIPALGNAPFEIWLHLSGDPKRIELFPATSQVLDEGLIESAIYRKSS
jgi:hypothetical protein